MPIRRPFIATLLIAAVIPFSLSAFGQKSVTEFGAKGDGVADDTAAIQRAVNEGGSLYFPKGSYRLLNTVRIELEKTGFAALSGDGSARIEMHGSGPAFHFVGTHGGTAAPESVKPQVWEKERTPSVTGLEIVGANPQADGLEASGTMQITISRVVVRKCRHALHFTTRNRNVLIADCHLYENSGIGVFYDEVNIHQTNIVGSHISYNAGGGVVSRGGNVRNLHIGTCDIESNHIKEGPPSANVELNSTGGSIGEVAITGCTLQHTGHAPGSANIRILGAGTDPSLARRVGRPHTREGNVTISANVFSDVRVNIEVRESRGVVISGNTFWEGFDFDLVAEDCEHLIVSDNNFDRNPRYAVNGFENRENCGLVFRRCQDTAITGNVIGGVMRQRAAVDIETCSRIVIANNSILDSDGVGLRLEGVTKSIVNANLIRDDRGEEFRSKEKSLQVLGGGGNEIGGNLLSNP